MASSTIPGSNGRSRKFSHSRKSAHTQPANAADQSQDQHDQTSQSEASNCSSRATSPTHEPHDRISEFDQSYGNEEHLEAFRRAIEENAQSESSAELISAVTDFIPVQQGPTKRTRHRKSPRRYNGYSYTLLRIPLMVLIFSVIAVEMWIYVCVRQIVNLWEYFVTWQVKSFGSLNDPCIQTLRGRRNQLRKDLRNASNYGEWKAAAQKLDTYMKKDEWKNDPDFGYYDYHLLSKVNRNLHMARKADRIDELKDNLQGVVKPNFGGVENARLYSLTYHGTKKPIEEYVYEVTASLQAVAESKRLSDEEKRSFLKSIYKNYGRTALCLSGGAGFGYYHLGVVRALLQAGVLPTVITGTSAGALMGKVNVSRFCTDFVEAATWFPRLIRKGARFDAEDWARKMQWVTKGGLTFMEAYERTGRILNISVIPYDPHSPPKLLNYLTTPDCVVWSAVIASAAIPGILNPVVLMRKRADGSLVPFSYGGRGFKDGSLRADIPLQALHTHFNVNYTIVSQVNPHVHLFFYAARGSVGRPVSHLYGEGWRGGFLAASIEQFLKLDLSKWLKVLRDLELLPRFMNQDWSWVWLQKFDGHVTILPKSGFSDWLQLLTDPNEKRLQHCLTVGERQTFPKLHMIANRMRIEQMIAQCRSEIKEKLDRKKQGRGNSRSRGASGLLSEDSENTVRARMQQAFGDAYNSKDATGGEYPPFGSRRRGKRVTSWPGLRYTLGHESVGDYRHSRVNNDDDDDDDDGEDDDDEEDEGMGMDEREDASMFSS
ncbi:hypothetical protein BGZ58_008365 [Dissophora ornata]|nr:hypothetical protein BGZ58_008365 [Dissophora ornata]